MDELEKIVINKINISLQDIDLETKIPKIDVIREKIDNHLDWDKTLPEFKGKYEQPEVLAMLLYEYSTGLENLTEGKISYKNVIEKMSSLMGKMRFGKWNENDSNVKYCNVPVTNPEYRENTGKGFGAQTIEYIEDNKLQMAAIAYDNNEGNGIDLSDINDLRHTFFHEWTHIMELDKVVGSKEQFVNIDSRTYCNSEEKENGEVWGNGLTTREYGENAEKYAEHIDKQGRKRIMHNQITEGMVELISRKIMEETIGKNETNKVIHKERYSAHTKIAQSIIDAFGEDYVISTFVSNSQQLVSKLEGINIDNRDALHYMSDFVNDQNYEQLIPKYSNRTSWFRNNTGNLIDIFKIPIEHLGELKSEIENSEINGGSTNRLEEIFSKYGTSIEEQTDIEKFEEAKASYGNLRLTEEKFYTGLSDLLVLKSKEPKKENNITFQQIGEVLTDDFNENPERAMTAFNILEQGVKKQEQIKESRFKG